MPTPTPHSSKRCQRLVIQSEATRQAATIACATSTTFRTPYLFISAAANGAMMPNRKKRTASAAEISEVDQPNSFCSGMMKMPGAPTAPAMISPERKVAPATTQP